MNRAETQMSWFISTSSFLLLEVLLFLVASTTGVSTVFLLRSFSLLFVIQHRSLDKQFFLSAFDALYVSTSFRLTTVVARVNHQHRNK
jgi:hypothetical protein